MGGIYITGRQTSSAKYVGFSTDVELPSNVNADVYKEILPEFLLGFYNSSDSYGVDLILACQNDGKYKLSYYSHENTCSPNKPNKANPEVYINLSSTDKIRMKAYLENNHIKFKVENLNGRTLGELEAPLKSTAKRIFERGCKIKRQIVIASNYEGNYTGYPVYINAGTLYNGTLTTTSWDSIPFAPSNTYAFLTEQADCSNGAFCVNLNQISIKGDSWSYEVRNGQKFSFEVGKADLRGPNRL